MTLSKFTLMISMLVLTSCQTKPKDPPMLHTDHPRGEILNKMTLAEIEKHVKNEKERLFSMQDYLVNHAVQEKNWSAAENYSYEYLKLAENYKDDWNYGNAIYNANVALGLVSLQKKNTKLAVEYLLKASKTPGSPQLDSFGPFSGNPDWDLTQELYKMGERKSLITFAENCLIFVTKEHGHTDDENKKLELEVISHNKEKLNQFISQVKAGTLPVRYHMP